MLALPRRAGVELNSISIYNNPGGGRQFGKHRTLIESYFRRWDSVTVIVGRFVAVGRAFTPFAAGLAQMESRRYLPMALRFVGTPGKTVLSLE